jgi:hypothetical protein
MDSLPNELLLNIMKYSYNPSLYCINTHFNELYKLRFKHLEKFKHEIKNSTCIYELYFDYFDDRIYLFVKKYSQCILEIKTNVRLDGTLIVYRAQYNLNLNYLNIIINKELIKHICRINDTETINILHELKIFQLDELIFFIKFFDFFNINIDVNLDIFHKLLLLIIVILIFIFSYLSLFK